MPRKGQGQKVQTARGQQYGQAKAQEEAQAAVPLPQMAEPSVSRQAPGAAPFARRSERPNEPIGATANVQSQRNMPGEEQRFKALTLLSQLEPVASAPYASPHLRNTVRKLKLFVGDTSELTNDGDQ
jgi:hypothetical protein